MDSFSLILMRRKNPKQSASFDCHGVVAAAIRQTVYQVKVLDVQDTGFR